jgi:rare lipoprotein A
MRSRLFFACAFAAIALAGAGCSSSNASNGGAVGPDAKSRSFSSAWLAGSQSGIATYYASSLAGQRTASGERYDPASLTAAHRYLPFGTIVEVRRGDGRRSVIVRINDRGPFGSDRKIIDLSYRAAQALGIVRAGTANVVIFPVRSNR